MLIIVQNNANRLDCCRVELDQQLLRQVELLELLDIHFRSWEIMDLRNLEFSPADTVLFIIEYRMLFHIY